MKMSEFLHDRSMSLLFHILGMAALSIFLYSTGSSPGVITLILIVWTLELCVFTAITYLKRRSEIRELEAIMNCLPQKYLFMECAPKPKSCYQRHMFNILRRAGKSMIETVSETEAKWKDYREYVENWVHEIKVPITAAELICENNKSEVSRKIRFQLALIDSHVERSLYYARLDTLEKDFILREVNLEDIVTSTLSKHRFLLTQNDVRIETNALEISACTDSKWVEFIIGQILSNAIKYKSRNPVIHIYTERTAGQIQLCVQDNGIGIPGSELRRIFDKGFTGSNGRALGGSTGMGLYLCRKLAGELGARLEADSVQHEYTKISISFPILSKV